MYRWFMEKLVDGYSGWISVKERLPEEDVDVIAWEKAGFAFIDSVKRGMWKVGENNFAVVTHWMPLPEPPKEGT